MSHYGNLSLADLMGDANEGPQQAEFMGGALPHAQHAFRQQAAKRNLQSSTLGVNGSVIVTATGSASPIPATGTPIRGSNASPVRHGRPPRRAPRPSS